MSVSVKSLGREITNRRQLELGNPGGQEKCVNCTSREA